MEESSGLVTAARLLSVIVLVLANGFFVAAEFSLVAIRRSRVEQLIAEGNPLAQAVKRATQRLDSYLAATQLGITMASLGLGWMGEPALAALIEPALRFLPVEWITASSHALSVAIAFFIITALHIVFGELAPKSLALQRTDGTALAVSQPLELFYVLFRPVITLLNGAGNFVVRLFGLHPASSEELAHSVEELRYLVTASRHAGVLDAVESEMVDNAFMFGETRAHQVMVPRTEMLAVSEDTSLDAVMDLVVRDGHSRLPVYRGTLDEVVGVVHLRDVVRAIREGTSPQAPVGEIVREPLFLPESASAETILAEMQRNRAQMVILIDEHGGTAGLVTMEDLLEEIVGDLQDEFELPHEEIRSEVDGTFLVDGLLPIAEFNEHFGVEMADEEYDTVGGMVMAMLGRVPKAGDELQVDGWGLTVESMDGRRVSVLRVARLVNQP